MSDRSVQQTLVFGIHPVLEAIEAGKEFEKVFLKRGLNSEAFISIRKKLRKHRIPYQDVPQEKLSRLTRKNHQGIVALLSPVEYSDLDEVISGAFDRGEEPLILVLDRVSDVGNFGAICRSAECAGVHGILVPIKGSAQLNAFAVKSSAGAIFNIDICRTARLVLLASSASGAVHGDILDLVDVDQLIWLRETS
ncbi:MAG: RNA methyltransferase [Flavobacteriales bacterium]|nr:RNA methyltransferase [Flavobacteriales bacterium]